MVRIIAAFLCVLFASSTLAEDELWVGVKRPGNIVHLFEWKFADVANECEQYLAPNGYKGVQISPVHENAVFPGRPWWERYQVFSYRVISRSGDETQFADMLRRCNKVGVDVFVDVVFNHMTGRYGDDVIGSSGDSMSIHHWNYETIPYTKEDFHEPCEIKNWNNFTQVRICQFSGLPDLNQTRITVQEKITDAMNALIDFGVAGFRVDAAKHMFPKDLYAIFKNLKPLREDYYGANRRPFIYLESSNSDTISV